MPGDLHRESFQIDLTAPLSALVRMEAETSGRTVSEHVGHILSRRYMELVRVCTCGFFIYHGSTDDQICSTCGKNICNRCAVQPDDQNYCPTCAPEGLEQKNHTGWGVEKKPRAEVYRYEPSPGAVYWNVRVGNETRGGSTERVQAEHMAQAEDRQNGYV